MQSKAMQRNTRSADLVLGRGLWEGAELILNPQVSRGLGLSGTRGAAAFPDGEAFRSGNGARPSTSPAPSVSRRWRCPVPKSRPMTIPIA